MTIWMACGHTESDNPPRVGPCPRCRQDALGALVAEWRRRVEAGDWDTADEAGTLSSCATELEKLLE